MRCATFNCGPWSKKGFISRTLLRVVPRANPDFDNEYETVTSWWFEIDSNNLVCREIAFDSSGVPVAAAPLGKNFGIFTDLQSAPEGLGTEVDTSVFEKTWQQFENKWLTTKHA
jgi:hypothetical protein